MTQCVVRVSAAIQSEETIKKKVRNERRINKIKKKKWRHSRVGGFVLNRGNANANCSLARAKKGVCGEGPPVAFHRKNNLDSPCVCYILCIQSFFFFFFFFLVLCPPSRALSSTMGANLEQNNKSFLLLPPPPPSCLL